MLLLKYNTKLTLYRNVIVFVYKHVVYLNVVHRLHMCSKLWGENSSGNCEFYNGDVVD